MEQPDNGSNPSPKSRFWRVHLSTLLLITPVASALLWANIRMQSIKGMPAFYCRGWPMNMMGDIRPEYAYENANQLSWDPTSVAINIAVAIVLIASVAGLSEFILRRK